MADPLIQSVSATRRIWSLLGNLGTWAMAQLSTFLLPPPVTQVKIWANFAHFCVAIVLGLTIVILMFRPVRKAVRAWWIATLLLIVMGFATFIGYQWILANRVIGYAGTQVIVGDRTADAESYRERYAKDEGQWLTDVELLAHYGGNISAVWTTESVERVRMLLALAYVATSVFLSLAMILIIQLVSVRSIQ